MVIVIIAVVGWGHRIDVEHDSGLCVVQLLSDLRNPAFDFQYPTTHPLQRWYGLQQFLLLSLAANVSSTDSGRGNSERAKGRGRGVDNTMSSMLLSSMVIASASSQTPLACFLALRENEGFVGYGRVADVECGIVPVA